MKGVEEKIEYTEDSAIETVSVDYSIAKTEEIAKLIGSQFEGNISGKISMKKSIELLEKSGFEKVE
ncbi:DUF1307 domain-containing protein [Lachnoclostridium phytofermentans]|uniref:DUF1307 domain-containing protein n=1 Tax=Lachnoclostridium phytofermentans TaxID=66219 RepID=UPI0009D6A267